MRPGRVGTSRPWNRTDILVQAIAGAATVTAAPILTITKQATMPPKAATRAAGARSGPQISLPSARTVIQGARVEPPIFRFMRPRISGLRGHRQYNARGTMHAAPVISAGGWPSCRWIRSGYAPVTGTGTGESYRTRLQKKNDPRPCEGGRSLSQSINLPGGLGLPACGGQA